LLEIADDGRNDWMARNGTDAVGYELNSEHIQRSKLRITTRMWHISKILPKVYGDKSDVTVTGPNNGPIQSVTATIPINDPIEASKAYQKLMSDDK
jgi:hypothetical protein